MAHAHFPWHNRVKRKPFLHQLHNEWVYVCICIRQLHDIVGRRIIMKRNWIPTAVIPTQRCAICCLFSVPRELVTEQSQWCLQRHLFSRYHVIFQRVVPKMWWLCSSGNTMSRNSFSRSRNLCMYCICTRLGAALEEIMKQLLLKKVYSSNTMNVYHFSQGTLKNKQVNNQPPVYNFGQKNV